MGMYASLTSYKGAPISEIYNSLSWSDALNIWARLVYGECIQRKMREEWWLRQGKIHQVGS